jgi:hypothetical protein
MKAVKIISLTLISILVFILITAAFLDGNYAIEKEISIAQPKSKVFEYLKYLKHQDEFSVWQRRDPNMKRNFKGNDGEVGFIYAWESKDEHVGTGEQEIIAIIPEDSIKLMLRFKVPFEAQDNAYLCTQTIDSTHTLVKWGFQGKFSYPFTIMKLVLNMEEAVGNDLGTGLQNLKTVLEKK